MNEKRRGEVGYEYACVVNTIHTAALHKTGGKMKREREQDSNNTFMKKK